MSWKRSIVMFIVLALCTVGAASALSLDPEVAEAPEGTGLLGSLLNRLLDWLEEAMAGGQEDVTSIWLDGCHLDPNGVCGGSN